MNKDSSLVNLLLLVILFLQRSLPKASNQVRLDYITRREQCVSILGSFSKTFETTSGVPLGGHLSPLFFSLFANSISTRLNKINFLLCADYLKIFHKIKLTIDHVLLQSELDIFTGWFSHLGLSLNISKCNIISFSRSLSPILTSYSLMAQNLNKFLSLMILVLSTHLIYIIVFT